MIVLYDVGSMVYGSEFNGLLVLGVLGSMGGYQGEVADGLMADVNRYPFEDLKRWET